MRSHEWRVLHAHTKAHLKTLFRTPAAIIVNTLYPVSAFVLFIVPQPVIAADPVASLTATGQLAVLGSLSGFVFGYGIAVSEDRANPWTQYVRSLPVTPWAALGARFAVAFVLVALSLVPLLLASALLTAAPAPFLTGSLGVQRLPLGALLTLVTGLPFLAIAVGIAYSATPKTALALAQVVVFPLAFFGGLIFPPAMMPPWASALSLATPARAARDITVGFMLAEPIRLVTVLVWTLWAVASCGFALWAYRRDEGRRFS